MNHVIVEKLDNFVIMVKLNRPEVRNALNGELRAELADIFANLDQDPTCRVVVLTGGDVFAAGADIKDMVNASTLDILASGVERLWKPIAEFSKPLLAAVNGFALGGGCELAMHADIIIAGEGAQFGQPEIRLGIMPGAGGTQRLIRAVGKFRAMKLLMTGELISAREAYEIGLVSQVVDDSETLDTSVNLAQKIASMAPLALKQIKDVALTGMDESLDVAMKLERKAFQLLFASKDQKEGMRAFLEKRKPVFTGE
ncbi:MAG: enoyl-CoA hydratase-related protein [Bdellovibrionota bacterium]